MSIEHKRQSRTFRVFISSTFSDLKAERNALQQHVFPLLQKLCEAHGYRFQVIDLRWGVSEEAALDQQTMNIALVELRRCQELSPRMNFICILGDRYGWIPLPPQVEASEFDAILSVISDPIDKSLLGDWYRLDTNAMPAEYVLRPRRTDIFDEVDYGVWAATESRLRSILLHAIDNLCWSEKDPRRTKYECSAVHQEIIQGALGLLDEREHGLAFFRNIRNLEDLPADNVYTDAGTQKLQALKREIQQSPGVTSFNYDIMCSGQYLDSHIERFTADALSSLTRIIEEEFQHLEEIDYLTREDIAHQEFGADRCRHFVGRQKILDDIASYVHGDQNSLLVVHGLSGAGRSAVMAKSVEQAEGRHRNACIIQRFIGATPESTDIRSLLENLCREITQAYGGDADTIPNEYKDLKEELPKRLRLATAEKPLIVFLDALEQLGGSDFVHSLNWLPFVLPMNVKVVVSVLEREDDAGRCFRSANSQLPCSALVRVGEMTPEEGTEALRKWLAEARRTLTDEQRESVLSGFRGCPTPLYLKLAFEEARRWKSYDGLPRRADDVPGLAGDVPGVVGDMLARLDDRRNHGEVLVKTFLGLLAAARHGLSETEILELLSWDREVMADLRARSARSPESDGLPAVVWLRLYHDLSPYLMERSADNTVLLSFYHRQVDETVDATYLTPDYHVKLADYFRAQADLGSVKWTECSWAEHGELPCSARVLRSLPYHAREGGATEIWIEAMTDFGFLQAVVQCVDVMEGFDIHGGKILAHAGYFVIQEEIERWQAERPSATESRELVSPLGQVWNAHQKEFVMSANSIMQSLYRDLNALDPKEVFDKATARFIPKQEGPLSKWCERERSKYETPSAPWVVSYVFNVFLSFSGEDESHARMIFHFLESKGLRVFFSRESIPQLAQADYMDAINDALDKARHMIVVSSSASGFAKPWVKREWTMFLNEKLSGRKEGNIVVVEAGNVPVAAMPIALRSQQVISLSESGLVEMLKFVCT